MKVFDNPNQLNLKLLERRFAQQDDQARFIPYQFVVLGPDFITPTGEIKYYVELETNLDDATVTGLLTPPITVEEQNYVNEFDSDRRNFRTQYQDTVTQLQAIEDMASPTNAQVVNAVKYLAKTVRLLIRLLVKTRFS